MKKLILGFALALYSLAQAAPALPDNNFIYVIGNGQVSVSPDRARIDVTVRASGPDHEKAFAQLQADSRAIVAAAVSLGVSDKDIDAHRISKSLRYESKGFSSGGTTLPELEQTVRFELRDLDKAVALADKVMKMQSVGGVATSFYVADAQAAEVAATAKAATDAQQRALELAKLFGRKLGRATALSVEPDGTMRERFGASTSRGDNVVTVSGNRAAANYRLPNAIDFNARLYVVYALE